MKNFIVGALIIGVAIIGGAFIVKNAVRLGASSGPTHYNMEYFYGGLVQGGGIVTIANATTTTLTATQVCGNDIIAFAANASVGVASTTFPTAATVINRCLAQNGDYKDVIFFNSSEAASTTVFVANTGNTIYYPTGGNTVIEGLNIAHLRFTRYSTSTVKITVEEGIVQ